ncbi:MAG: enoyl-CoA hydratase/isomerase family protein [Myxococcota bacterium]
MNATAAVEVAPGFRTQVGAHGIQHWWLSNEARRNAVSPAALEWIAMACAGLRGEVVVLRGAGGRAFCAGFDLTALTVPAPEGSLPDSPLIAATTAMQQADATFVAVIEGYAIGAGVELACACDLRIARQGAFFAIPAAELGVVYHAHGLQTIREVFGPAGVRRLLLLGDRITAQEAYDAGALVRLPDTESLESTVDDVIARLRRAAPLSIQGNRDLLRTLDRGPVPPEVATEHEARRRASYTSEDQVEARQARLQGRRPKFRGR